MRRVGIILAISLGLLLVVLAAAGVGGDIPICEYCHQPIMGDYVRYQGHIYHSECYLQHIAPRCAVCGEPLEGDWIVYNGKNYHRQCYDDSVALRCSVCGGIIKGKYLVDYWGNKYHAYHQDQVAACSFCGRLLSDSIAGGGQRFDDEHYICLNCSRGAVRDEDLGRQKLDQARALLERAGIDIGHQEIKFELVSRDELAGLLGRDDCDDFGLARSEETSFLGLLNEKQFTVYILKGLPPKHYLSVAAHELMHVWLYLNAPPKGEPALVEGSCNYAARLVLRQFDDDMAKYVLRQLQANPDPIYGEGFRRVKKLVERRGLEFWLQHLRFDPEFPIGY